MSQNLSKKICIIVDCLSIGGAEKAAALLSVSLSQKDYCVSIISIKNEVEYQYKGDFFHLEEIIPRNKVVKQIYKLFQFQKVIKKINADFYLDFRFRGRYILEAMLHLFVLPARKMIFTMHSNHIEYHKPKGYFYNYFYKKAYRNIAVSSDINQKLIHDLKYKNSSLVYNFVNLDLIIQKLKGSILPSGTALQYIIVTARLTPIKQLDKLIKAYQETSLASKNILLYILGDGTEKEYLKNVILELGLSEFVKILGFVQNPYVYMKHAMFGVLSSKEEGFPMVILETLACGTPMITFNCKSGPSEIIKHKENGLLVKDQDFNELSKAIEIMANNEELLLNCNRNTVSSIKNFTEKNIINDWLKILN